MNGWEAKKLGDVAAINYGYTEKASFHQVGPRFLRITDIQEDHVNWETVPYCPIDEKGRRKFLLKSGDIVFARTGATTGKSFLIDNPPEAVFASYLIRLRVLEADLLPEFLSYFFRSASYWESVSKGIAGSAQGGFNASKLGELRIPLPPLDEQRRIVAILDEAFAGLAVIRQRAEANLKNARALFDSHLNAVFSQRGEGWVVKKLGEVADCCLGKMLDKAKNRGTPKPYLRNINVRWFEFDLSDLLEMPFENYEFDRYSAVSGDVLICEGGYPGRAAIWQSDEPVFFQKAIHRVRFADRDRAQWLVYYLWLLDGSGQLKSHFTGAGIQHFTGQALKKLEIPLPPLHEQSRILARIVELQVETTRLEFLYRQKLAAIDELKQAILHRAFSGVLTREGAPAVAAIVQPANDNRQTTAIVMALAFTRHQRANRDKSFGHVKAQKILHMVEAEVGFDLGRTPRRDAAGPNDFPHMLAAEDWAVATKHFSFSKSSEGYTFKPLTNFDALTKAARAIEPVTRAKIERIIDLFIPMDMQQSEVFATVYAAWNNLLIEGKPVTDEAIIRAAREDWHPNKLKIDRVQFVKAIRQLRDKNCTPSGQGKFVQPSQQTDLFA